MSWVDDIRRYLAKAARPTIPPEIRTEVARHWSEWWGLYPEAASDFVRRARLVAGDDAVQRVLSEISSAPVAEPPPVLPEPSGPVPGAPPEPAIRWGKREGRVDQAQVLPILPQVLSATAAGVRFAADLPREWPQKRDRGASLDAVIYLGWWIDGHLTLFKFDWLRLGQRSKGWENVHAGYCDGRQPSKGAACVICIASVTGHQRTTVSGEFPWPG